MGNKIIYYKENCLLKDLKNSLSYRNIQLKNGKKARELWGMISLSIHSMSPGFYCMQWEGIFNIFFNLKNVTLKINCVAWLYSFRGGCLIYNSRRKTSGVKFRVRTMTKLHSIFYKRKNNLARG